MSVGSLGPDPTPPELEPCPLSRGEADSVTNCNAASAAGVQVQHASTSQHKEAGQRQEAAASGASEQKAGCEFGIDGSGGHGVVSLG